MSVQTMQKSEQVPIVHMTVQKAVQHVIGGTTGVDGIASPRPHGGQANHMPLRQFVPDGADVISGLGEDSGGTSGDELPAPLDVYPVVVGTPSANAAFLRAFLNGVSDAGADDQNVITTLAPSTAFADMALRLGFGQSLVRSDARGQSSDVQKPMPLPVDMPATGELLGNQPASLAGGHAPRAAGLASCEISDGKKDLSGTPAGDPICEVPGPCDLQQPGLCLVDIGTFDGADAGPSVISRCPNASEQLGHGQGFDEQQPVPLTVDMPAKGELLGNQPASLAGGHAPRAAGLATSQFDDGINDLPGDPAGDPICKVPGPCDLLQPGPGVVDFGAGVGADADLSFITRSPKAGEQLEYGQGFGVQQPVPLSVDRPATGELLGNQPASQTGGHANRAAGLASCGTSDGKRGPPAAPARVSSDAEELRRALTKARCRAEGAVDTHDVDPDLGNQKVAVDVDIKVAGDTEASWIMPDLFDDNLDVRAPPPRRRKGGGRCKATQNLPGGIAVDEDPLHDKVAHPRPKNGGPTQPCREHCSCCRLSRAIWKRCGASSSACGRWLC